QWKAFDPVDLRRSLDLAVTATRDAESRIAQADPVERALIGALRHHYPVNDPDQAGPAWNDHYAAAMHAIYPRQKDDLDVAALFAEALMNRTPWQLWDVKTGEPAEGAETIAAQQVLERAMAQPGGTRHPGILHLYVHLMEMSPHPERALR